MTYDVTLTDDARADLILLYDFVLEREMARDGGDVTLADKAYEAIDSALTMLARAPFTYRRSDIDTTARELVVPFGATGYVILFEIRQNRQVIIAGVRHQRESGYAR